MKKSFFLFLCLHNLIAERFATIVFNDNGTWTSTMRVCDERFMLEHCHYSENREFKSNPTKSEEKLVNIIVKELVLVCSIDEFHDRGETTKTLVEIMRFEDACNDHNVTRNMYYKMNFKIVIRSSRDWPIINQSMSFFHEYDLKRKNWDSVRIALVDFDGFDIESKIDLNLFEYLDFTFSNGFALYKKNRLVRNCSEFVESSSTGFIFDSSTGIFTRLTIKRPAGQYPICSLFFRNAFLYHLTWRSMINSYYLKSVLTFSDPPLRDNFLDLNSTITHLHVSETYGIEVNSNFLNTHVFSRIKYITFAGHLSLIETNVFKTLANLIELVFDLGSFLPLIRKQGIEWVKSINSNLNVDLNNRTDVEQHIDSLVRVKFSSNREILCDTHNRNFYDQDFCLFVDFPFRQLVFFMPYLIDEMSNFRYTTSFTCTELWLFQFYQITKRRNQLSTKKLRASNFTACQFQLRVNKCRKSDFKINLNESKKLKVTSLDKLFVFEVFFMILGPVLGVFGIATNLVTIRVIFDKKNTKTMREKHYLYLSAYCICNLVIFLTQVIDLTSRCQYPFGFLCSSIRKTVFIQYTKIILVDYLNSTCRLLSNFVYLGFSLCRLGKIGNDHGKFIVFINNLSIQTFVAISLVISACIALCKPFQYQINWYDRASQVFPQPVFQFAQDWQYHTGYVVAFVFDFVYMILNYFVFVFVHLVVDLVLVKKLIEVLREKEDKLREMKKSTKEVEEAARENEESKRRIVLMVVLNSILNVCTRFPLMITSVNDLRILIQKPNFELQDLVSLQIDEFSPIFTFKFYCSSVKACVVFQSFGNCLYLFSLSPILFFLKRFDKNFKKSYETCFAASSGNSSLSFQKNQMNQILKD